jgi:hypothetical protein
MARDNRRRGSGVRSSRSFSRSSPTPAEIYDDLLEDVLQHSTFQGNRPLKRRKGSHIQEGALGSETGTDERSRLVHEKKHPVDVITISSDLAESDDENAMEWDDISLTALPALADPSETPESQPQVREISLNTSPKHVYISNGVISPDCLVVSERK